MSHNTRRPRRTARGGIKRIRALVAALILTAAALLCGCRFDPFPQGYFAEEWESVTNFFASLREGRGNAGSSGKAANTEPWITVNGETVPAFDGENAVFELNGNVPLFTEEERAAAKESGNTFERYTSLDRLGRTGTACACLATELMPGAERGSIDYPRPSGYVNRRYAFIDNGQYLYNHCHLIGYQLTGQTDNALNIITGTRFMNVNGMLPYENLVAELLRDSRTHVLYRVTPVYAGSDLVARGVEMEAWSVEDNGRSLCYHVFCYNAQPGVEIDYATGDNRADGTK